MTRTEFRDKFKHELSGILLDGMMSSAKGAAVSMLIRTLMMRQDALLGEMYDELAPKPSNLPAVTNGTNGTHRKV